MPINQIKKVVKHRKDNITQDQLRIYTDFQELTDQALHARIISDAIWKYRWERVARTGVGNSIISFSQVALENFSIQQLWKLFDRKNSVFHVWYVANHLPHPELLKWLDENIKKIQKDIDLISEWRHTMVGHRAEAGYFAPDEYEKKFSDARSSEKRMQDFLLDFLCQIKFEMQGLPIEKTMEVLKLGVMSYESYIKTGMTEVFKDL